MKIRERLLGNQVSARLQSFCSAMKIRERQLHLLVQ
jgi:hypothetical protein